MLPVAAVPVVFAVLAAACASTGGIPRPFPVPSGSAGTPGNSGAGGTSSDRSADNRRTAADDYALTGTALALRGRPYRDGGADPGGFDCSGFTQYVFAQHGLALPRSVHDQFRLGRAVKPDELSAGDLVFFATVTPGASHVAIALGGDEFIHAPNGTGVVRVEHLSSPYWSQRFVGARRVN